jgi:hypothetical protein
LLVGCVGGKERFAVIKIAWGDAGIYRRDLSQEILDFFMTRWHCCCP